MRLIQKSYHRGVVEGNAERKREEENLKNK